MERLRKRSKSTRGWRPNTAPAPYTKRLLGNCASTSSVMLLCHPIISMFISSTPLPFKDVKMLILISIIRFVKENYDKTSPLSMLEQGREMGKRWRELGAEEKEVCFPSPNSPFIFDHVANFFYVRKAYKQRAIEVYEREKAAAAAVEAKN
jgi:hypothetical protein